LTHGTTMVYGYTL